MTLVAFYWGCLYITGVDLETSPWLAKLIPVIVTTPLNLFVLFGAIVGAVKWDVSDMQCSCENKFEDFSKRMELLEKEASR